MRLARSSGVPADARHLDSHADGSGPAIDLAHLRRYTLGDVTLEREILALFAEHASGALSHIESTRDELTRRHGAHSLKGSALAVGAWKVARVAAAAEDANLRREAVISILEDLAVAVAEACDFITAYQSDDARFS